MRIATLVFLLANMMLSLVQAKPKENLATTTVIYDVHPLFASKIYERWLAGRDRGPKEPDGAIFRGGMNGQVSALGVIIQRGENVSVNHSGGDTVLIAKLTPENHGILKKGYRILFKAEARVITEKEFKGMQDKKRSEEAPCPGNPSDDPFSK